MMLAVTPILALLIESRMPSSEVSEPIVTVLVLVGVPPVARSAPKSTVIVPPPMAAFLSVTCFETSDCAVASDVTSIW
ncbi:hypothetical protein D3C87_1361840 [compost metagenome]